MGQLQEQIFANTKWNSLQILTVLDSIAIHLLHPQILREKHLDQIVGCSFFWCHKIVTPTVLLLWIVSPSKTDLQRVIYQPVVKHSNGKFTKIEVLMGKSSINLDCRQVGQQGWVPIDQPPLISSSPSPVVLFCHQRRFTHKESTARARKRAVPSGFI